MEVENQSPASPPFGKSDRFNFGRAACPLRRLIVAEGQPPLYLPLSFLEFLCEFLLMRRAIYPGSFDPVTNGHLDVIERARKLFDEVMVAVAHNDEKQALFSLQERLDLLGETAGKIDNVRVAQFEGLLVEFARTQKAGAVIRGLRAVSDFEFEFQMALMNRKLDAAVETIFLMPKEEYTYLSSRIVKEIASLGGNVSSFVPACVAKALSKKFSR
jgi:pantetheine-phosphate adenylyltransferase